MSRIAIIDLGTNTFNLLVVENRGNDFHELITAKIPVKLGEGGINRNIISAEAFQRGLLALKEYQVTMQMYKVEKILAFATSAIRGASNGNDFIEKAFRETGITIKKISGEEEAEYIYYGVRAAVNMNAGLSLIMDIGGGSTEFSIADKDKITWKHSFLLGAARLLERFNPSDPIEESEISEIENYFEEELKPLIEAVKNNPVSELIGSSGAFDSFADMVLCNFHIPHLPDGVTEYTFNLEEYYIIHKKIIQSSRQERMQMKGLVEMRVDMIVLSSLFVNFILKRLGIQRMRLSTFSLKEGVLVKHFQGN